MNNNDNGFLRLGLCFGGQGWPINWRISELWWNDEFGDFRQFYRILDEFLVIGSRFVAKHNHDNIISSDDY